jgi:Retinal pigment epithelial membrane protein
MAQPFPKDDPYLALGFEPIRSECDCADLIVEGALPASLAGTLYRIGPNPQYAPRGPYNPLLADGMIHAFAIRDGRVAYRNRWVRTEQWKIERAAGPGGGGPEDRRRREHESRVARRKTARARGGPRPDRRRRRVARDARRVVVRRWSAIERRSRSRCSFPAAAPKARAICSRSSTTSDAMRVISQCSMRARSKPGRWPERTSIIECRWGFMASGSETGARTCAAST